MRTALLVLIVLVALYVIGVLGMWAWTRQFKAGLLWPLVLVWMLLGNVQ